MNELSQPRRPDASSIADHTQGDPEGTAHTMETMGNGSAQYDGSDFVRVRQNFSNLAYFASTIESVPFPPNGPRPMCEHAVHVSRSNQTTVTLLTYGSGRYSAAKDRLAAEAKRSGMFDQVWAHDHESLPNEYWRLLMGVRRPSDKRLVARGAPRVLLLAAALEGRLREGDIVLYLDAGFVIRRNRLARERFRGYLQRVRANGVGILTMCLPLQPDARFTNAYVLRRLGVSPTSAVATSGQVESGFLLVHNTAATRRFFAHWRQLVLDDASLITDEHSAEAPQQPRFQAHRHEQSVLSLLLKSTYGPVPAPFSIPDETYAVALGDASYPFVAARCRSGGANESCVSARARTRDREARMPSAVDAPNTRGGKREREV